MSEVMSFQDACEYLQLAKPTLYKYVRNGDIPAFKVGRIWRFHRDSLEEWVRKRVKHDTRLRMLNRKAQ